MASWKFRCTLAVFLLAAMLAMPLTAEPRVRTERDSGAVWNLLADVWNKLTAVWEAEGCKIDPFVGCGNDAPETPAPTPSSDNGFIVDPYGGS
jgi:hypothetical protein